MPAGRATGGNCGGSSARSDCPPVGNGDRRVSDVCWLPEAPPRSPRGGSSDRRAGPRGSRRAAASETRTRQASEPGLGRRARGRRAGRSTSTRVEGRRRGPKPVLVWPPNSPWARIGIHWPHSAASRARRANDSSRRRVVADVPPQRCPPILQIRRDPRRPERVATR